MKKVILIGIGIIVFIGIVGSKANKTADKSDKTSLPSPTATEQPIITVTDSEREIFYKFSEYEWSLPTVPIGDKSRHIKAISLTAEEFHISTDEAEKIYEKVTKAKPSGKEIEIYEAVDKKTEDSLDSGSFVSDEVIQEEIAKLYGISAIKLKAIWMLVATNSEYQEQRKGKVAQELQKDKQNNLIENRKKILQDYIKNINDAGVNQFIESVSYKYAGTDECSIVIRVRNSWHYQHKQIRLQAAQNLWNLWTQSYYLEDNKDKCRMELVDLNGNNVGGSSWLGGSVVNVKD